jgi:hypothetical protein
MGARSTVAFAFRIHPLVVQLAPGPRKLAVFSRQAPE